MYCYYDNVAITKTLFETIFDSRKTLSYVVEIVWYEILYLY